MELLSERLRFLPLAPSNLDDLFHLDSDAQVMKFIKAMTPTREAALAKLNRYLSYAQTQQGLGAFALYQREHSEFVGFGFLVHIELNPLHDKIEVGYRLHQKFWGQGLASEVTKVLLGYGFNALKLSDIYGTTDPDHVVSQAVLQKAGLKNIGAGPFHDGCTLFHIKNPGTVS